MRTKLDKNSATTPIYMQVCEIVIDAIKKGEFTSGELFLSERKLMEVLDVSRDTVRKAFDKLQELGYLKKEHGRGTFVQLPNFTNNSPWNYQFASATERITTELLYFRIILCPTELCEKMNLTPKDFVYKFIRLRKTESEVVLMDYNYLNYMQFEGLSRKDVENNSLYEIITKWYRTPLTKAEDIFQLTRLNQYEAQCMNCSENDLCMEKIRYSYFDDKIFFVSRTLTVNERLQFKSIINGKI